MTEETALQAARERAATMPLEEIDVSDPELFRQGVALPYFARLRRDAPIHWQPEGHHGAFWSVTRFQDIMAVDTNHADFSSDWRRGGITVVDVAPARQMPMFIAMDPPRHDEERKAVAPIVAPTNLARLSGTIRERVVDILDHLPRDEPFDWVDRVSVELTTRMLATLFDFPFEDRRLLTHWSNVSTYSPPESKPESWAWRDGELRACLEYFTRLWNERVNAPPRPDLVSMLAHSPATRNMTPEEYLGNLTLLIVGGNDTTRNSISGGLLFFDRNPGEWAKLRANPALVPGAVSEIIRYQTPLAHMRRTAVRDVELGGHRIREGDKVVMWYVSGNRDDTAIEEPDAFRVDRTRPRQHLSFGFGIHRCVGNRLAEMQLAILLEEMLARDLKVEVTGEPERVPSSFINGYKHVMARIVG
ncbi:MAG: cytochrome P450 [Burkholderiaceae bacterium]|nr:cytochrome P450 [Burkholderiaceae bacterium]